jgi:tryptophanyl-tRNA synthetase
MKQLRLYLYLNMLAYKGELEKTPTFQRKARLQPTIYQCRLLTYPVFANSRYYFASCISGTGRKDQEQSFGNGKKFCESL